MIVKRSEELSFSKRGRRTLTSLFTEELLYDYSQGKLDLERKTSVEIFLKEHPETRIQLQTLNYAITYTQAIGQCTLSEETLKAVVKPPTYTTEILNRIQFEHWPSWLRWSSEAFFLGCLVSILASLVPWGKLITKWEHKKQAEIVLAEMNSGNRLQLGRPEYSSDPRATQIATSTNKNEAPIYPDDSIKISEPIEKNSSVQNLDTWTSALLYTDSNITTPVSPSIVYNYISFADNIENSQETVLEKVSSKPVSVSPATTAATKAAVSTQTTTPTTLPYVVATASEITSSSASNSTQTVTQGVLYRGSLYVSNLLPTSQKLVKLIEDLGGRKAGDVPLGWKKENYVYFHFTVPTAKLEQLQKDLKMYGSLKIDKEKHFRIMPEGISRLIVSVYEGPIHEETPVQ